MATAGQWSWPSSVASGYSWPVRGIVIIPAYNEEKSILSVLSAIPKTLPHISDIRIILIDDGSTDATASVARSGGASVLSHPERRGLAAAFRSGLAAALADGADIIVTIDADAQYRAQDIAVLWKTMQESGSDLVVGDRCVLSCMHMPVSNRIGNTVGSLMLRMMRVTRVRDASSGFRIFSARLGRSLRIRSRHTYTHEMLIQAHAYGFRTADVPVTFLPRAHGKSKLVRTLRHHILRSCGTILRSVLHSWPHQSSLPVRRVLFISRTCGAGYGGMQTYVTQLLASLASRSDLSLRCVGYRGGPLLLPLFFVRALFSAVFSRADTVHLGDALLSPICPVLALLRPRLRRTVTVHGLDVVWNAPGYQSLIRFSLSFAHRIVAISQSTAEMCVTLGLDAERIVVVPCGIAMPSEIRRILPQDPVLLSLGRLVLRKGIAWFLADVFPLLLARYPRMTFVIAGAGPEFAHIQSIITTKKLSSSVSLRGPVSEAEKNALFLSASVFIMPNIPVTGDMEGFGISALEAASRGLPVVAADLEGLKDSVLEDVTGLHFSPQNAEAAFVATTKALERHWNTEEMRAALKKIFDIDLIASRFVHEIF